MIDGCAPSGATDVLTVTVTCAAADSGRVAALLRGFDGAVDVTCHAGACVSPPGDVFTALVTRTSAQQLVDDLTGDVVAGGGSVRLTPVELVFSPQSRTALATASPTDDGMVWDELVETIGQDSTLTLDFVAFLTLGALLAAVGAITHSAVLIVGAMVVSPDFGPLAGLAVAAVGRRRRLALRAAVALGGGFPLAIGFTALAALAGAAAGIVNADQLVDLGDASFVTQVGPYSIIVAMLAGTAGMLALTSRTSTALVGVCISITTIPAAGLAAVSAVLGQWHVCVQSVEQLALNLGGVVLASTITLWWRRNLVGTHPPRSTRLVG